MNESQIAFSVLYLAYVAVTLFFHNTIILYPFRLLTTFLHEISHALACWLTCGKVIAIRVFENEGGVTQYIGGCRIAIIPAGYVGSAIWGSFFVMLSGGQKTATGAAALLVVILLVSLCYAPNRTMIKINLFYAVLTSIFIYLEWMVFSPILNYIVLWYGVFVNVHAIYDTYQDTIRRTVQRSDAYACYEQCPCCMPKCVGIQWGILNISLQILGAWIALVQMSDGCENKGWWECMAGDFAWDFNGDEIWRWKDDAMHNVEDLFNN
mmetsp:Transcript_18208/g.30746  ORF Transcript_18208/g.30746 Transcript_18208/m.30746 type:complete len:266 (-) Transcript_18208:846-1643(-)